jgi:predicted N-formylglutamate amidohydrolase
MHHDWVVVITVEHASNAVPDGMDLGVQPEVLDSHVAWDPGAPEVASIIAAELSAPLFLGRYTRLVADLNRSPENPASVPEVAFGVPVPANTGLTPEARAARLKRFHTPFWKRVQSTIEGSFAVGGPNTCVLHLSIHSFVGEFAGEVREMSMGVMLDPDQRLERHAADLLLEGLQRLGVHAVENEPYDGRGDALVVAMRRRYSQDRYAGVQIEISQNHLEEIEALGHRLRETVQWLKTTD